MSVDKPSTGDTPFEPCPTPLAWQEVAQSFYESAASRIFATDEAELKVTEFGQGRPLVFFPGASGSARLFCLTAWLLREEFQSVILEFPRFRRRPAVQSLVQETAEPVSLVLEHYCPQGADVYASSFSSQIALQIMATRPKVIRRSLLQCAWARRKLNSAERLLLTVGKMAPGKLRHLPLWKSMQIENHRRWFPPFDETRFGFLLQEAGETPTATFARRLSAAAQTDLTPQLQQIHQRVLVLHCEGEGQQIAEAEAELERQLPNCEREEMYHSGHFPYLTHPHRLVKVIRPFFGDS